MVVLVKKPFCGQIPVKLEENQNACEIFFGGDVGIQIENIIISIVCTVILLFSIFRKLEQ